jgi:hypothetical protein
MKGLSGSHLKVKGFGETGFLVPLEQTQTTPFEAVDPRRARWAGALPYL